MGEIINGPSYIEDGWIVATKMNKFTGKQVGLLASRPIDPEVQKQLDKIFEDARIRKENTLLRKLQKKVIEAFNLDTY
jgi:hypothetical protein